MTPRSAANREPAKSLDEAAASDDSVRLPSLIGEQAEVLAVRVAGAEFGLPVKRVRNVIRVPSITRIPFPPPSVLGVASVRGVIVPVIDLGDRLGGEPASRSGRLVLVETGNQEIALLVDAVTSLIPTGTPRSDAPAEVEASLPAGWIAGVLSPDPERLITLLELEPVLAVSSTTDKEQE